eukprot:gene901-9812_t
MFHLKKTIPSSTRAYSSKTLAANVKKYLKPEVVKYLESKEDPLLIQKVNYVAPELSVRLNVAPQLLLEQVTSENVFDILSNQITDVWQHYWFEVKKNGIDNKKWMESIQECIDWKLPYMANICWSKGKNTYGTVFNVEEFKVMFAYYAEMGFQSEFALLFDDLNRVHQTSGPDSEVDQLWVKLLYNKRDYQHCKSVMDYFTQKKGTKFDDAFRKEVEDKLNSFDNEPHAEYIDSLRSKDHLSPYQKHKDEFKNSVLDTITKSLELSVQPLNALQK